MCSVCFIFCSLDSQEALRAMFLALSGRLLDINTRERGPACDSSLIYPDSSDVIYPI